MFALVTIRSNGGHEWTETVRANEPILVGRMAEATIRLDSDLVSRQHAVVFAGPGGIRVQDRSTNGTLVGGSLVQRDVIDATYGTPIVLGDYTLTVTLLDANGRLAAAPEPIQTMQPMQPMAYVPPTAVQPIPLHFTGQVPISQQGADPIAITTLPTAAPPPAVAPLPTTRSTAVPSVKDKADNANLRRSIHQKLIEHLDLASVDALKMDDPSMRPKILAALRSIVQGLRDRLPAGTDPDTLIGELVDEALGLGPLEQFLADPAVSEIMVVDPDTIYVERSGKITLTNAHFTDDDRVRAAIERILTPLGRRIDESSPMVDARLKDGSRVNAIIRPLALRGSCITIRKFAKVPLTMDNLYKYGTLTPRIGLFLSRSVAAKKNVLISGGTGSGKTTLLNVLSGFIPEDERIVTIEDAAELQLRQPHVVSLETKPANLEGRGEYTIRDLVRNALRMRPDRIVVGECRGGEALDMLQAMNTGHDGSLTTTHANSPVEAIRRLETLVLMAGMELPSRAIREQIASSIHLIVQQSRLNDGTRKVTAVSEVAGLDHDSGEVRLRPIYEFVRTGMDEKGKIEGEFRSTGYLPSYIQEFITRGLIKPGEPFL